LKGINDDEIEDLINLTKDMPVNIRFIELMPIGEGEKLYSKNFISNDEVIESLTGLIPLESKEGSTAKLYTRKGYKGTIGFISPLSCKFCSSCNRIRLTSMGTIKPCLHSENEINIKEVINDELKLRKVLKDVIFNKPAEHKLNEEGKSESHRKMYEIGG
ncbi:MAG: GTP 3',8-cyclase MoaA, partial [Clostridiaceae bacterium]